MRDVERAHRLPAGYRQHPLVGLAGRIYQDVKYAGYGTVIELDGVNAHPISGIHRDLRRDNVAAATGDSVLHYGWSDVTARPCEVALQVGRRLALGGWDGPLRACARPDCMIAKELSRYGVADHS